MSNLKTYRRPTNPFIGSQEEKLYKLEAQRDAAFKKATEELQRVLKLKDFWHEALPEGIFSMLDHWDKTAAEIAAICFLERRGFSVTAKEESKDPSTVTEPRSLVQS